MTKIWNCLGRDFHKFNEFGVREIGYQENSTPNKWVLYSIDMSGIRCSISDWLMIMNYELDTPLVK